MTAIIFIPMLVLLCLGTVLWVKIDPTRPLFAEQPTRGTG
jgi:hypothetical protein